MTVCPHCGASLVLIEGGPLCRRCGQNHLNRKNKSGLCRSCVCVVRNKKLAKKMAAAKSWLRQASFTTPT